MYSRSNSSSQDSHRSLGGSQLSNVTDEELVRAVEELKNEIQLINTENEILEKTIQRLDPSLMQGVYQAFEYIKRAMQSDSQVNVGSGSFAKFSSRFSTADSLYISPSKFFSSPSKLFTSTSKMFTSPSRYSKRGWIDSSGNIGGSIVSGTGPRINLIERLELTSVATGELKAALSKRQRDYIKQQALFKAQFEEIEIRIEDIEKAKYKFERKVIIDGWDLQAHRIPAEIWVHFMSESIRTYDVLLGKYRLRTSTLCGQSRILKDIINRKVELRENLDLVDFEMLQIENVEYSRLFDRKTFQLEELKKMTGNAHLALTLHKQKLLFMHTYLDKVTELKTRREVQTKQIDKQMDSIKPVMDKLERRIDAIHRVRMEYHVPKIADYLNAKIEANELKNAIKRLEVKLNIKKHALKNIRKELNVLKSQGAIMP